MNHDVRRISHLTDQLGEARRRVEDLEIENRRLMAIKSGEIAATMNDITQQRLTEAEFHLWAMLGILGLEPVAGEPEEMSAARAWLVAS